MAKHRAPAQIEYATTVEKTWLHEAVDRSWKPLAIGAALVTVVVLYRQQQASSRQAGIEEDWGRLTAEASFNMMFGSGPITVPSASVLSLLAEDLGDSPAGSWAKALEIGKFVEDERFAEAEKALGELSIRWPDHVLVTQALFPGGDGNPPVTLARHIQDRSSQMTAWEEGHPLIFGNPEPPADAPRVRITTEKGDIVVALYHDRAPQHSENFLELCGKSYYDGTLFHRVLPRTMIQGGDPNTVDGDPDTWGLGGPEKTIEAEIDPALRHYAGVLAAAKKSGDTRSSGSQFYITIEANHGWNGTYTVFGVVVEGIEVALEIAAGAATGDRPDEPVILQSTEVL
jgi:peptidyl-prolyl cis-trans isomerase B (cyclophilin B)